MEPLSSCACASRIWARSSADRLAPCIPVSCCAIGIELLMISAAAALITGSRAALAIPAAAPPLSSLRASTCAASPNFCWFMRCRARKLRRSRSWNGIGGGDDVRLQEQGVGFGEGAEIGALQGAVDQIFAEVATAFAVILRALEQRVEELGGFRIIAAVVAPITFVERLGEIEAAGLDARERGGVAGLGRRDRDLAGDDAIGDDRAQAERQGAVIAGQAFGNIDRLAAVERIDPVGDFRSGELALRDRDGLELVQRLRGGAVASGLVAAQFGQALERVAGLAQGIDAADRLRGIPANDRISAVEHALDRRVEPGRLHLAERVAPGAEPEAVLQRRARLLLRSLSGRAERTRGQYREPHSLAHCDLPQSAHVDSRRGD
jgi:hypothetical protein